MKETKQERKTCGRMDVREKKRVEESKSMGESDSRDKREIKNGVCVCVCAYERAWRERERSACV